MKTRSMIFIFCLIASLGVAQKIDANKVPKAVTDAFAKAYPGVKGVKWDKEKELFEASFDNNKQDMSVLFDANGTVKEVETEIEQKDLPASVKNSLAKEYADYKVKEAAKISADGVTTYEAEVTQGKKSFDFIFDANGKLLKKVETTKEKKEGKEAND